jgi:glutathione S-transferase
MSQLYFHHYATSPFAEKIRLMFGLKGITWHSVDQPSIMPKPELQALTGGYRRIPVLQVGNDIICDTSLIADVLEHVAPTPSLFPKGSEGAARIVAQWADSMVFSAAMAYNFQPAGAMELFKGQSPETGAVFAADRKAMRGGAPRLSSQDAHGFYLEYLRRIHQMLQGHAFLFGEQPSLADFACYHALWFTRRLNSVSAILAEFPALLPWMDRMAALGQGKVVTSDAATALAICAAGPAQGSAAHAFLNQGGSLDLHGLALGTQVGISAETFGLEVSRGELIGATATHYSIARHDPAAGRVHVHFPRLGFVLKALVD